MLGIVLAVALGPEPLPPLSDCDRFPPTAWCEEQEKLAKAHLAVFEGHRLFEPHRAAFWDEAISQTKGALAAYEALDWARYESYSAVNRRPYLVHLKAALGERDYAAGRMPVPVPLWALKRLD